MNIRNRLITISALALGVGCNDDTEAGIPDLSGKPSFAVQLSDYQSAGVALVDGDGALLEAKYLSSGTEVPGLSAALHSDIAFPTTPCDPGLLTVIARFGGDYVMQVDLDTNEVVGQFKTHSKDVPSSYSSNPHDLLCLGDGRALISRFEPNIDPEADVLDAGSDLIIMDLDDGSIVDRVDLSAFDGKGSGFDDLSGGAFEEKAYARPSSIVRVGKHAVVGMSRGGLRFTTDPVGMVGIIDLKTLKLTAIKIEGLAQCDFVTPVASSDDQVIVSCAGAAYFGDPETSGLALLHVHDDGEAEVEHIYKQGEGKPQAVFSPVSIGGSRVVAVKSGDWADLTPDVLYEIDLETGDAVELAKSKSVGELGAGYFRFDTGLLLVPDASKGIRVFDVSKSAVEQLDTIKLDAALPARGIRPLVEM